MGVITISRAYGSDGRTVGLRVAEALGYLYLDKELVIRVALEAGVPVSKVECFDEQPEHPVIHMFKKALTSSALDALGTESWTWVPGRASSVGTDLEAKALLLMDEGAYVRLTQKVMWRLTNGGNVVIMGRGAYAYLAHQPDVLHVRIVAPETFRVQTVVQRDGLSHVEAAKQIRKVDQKRRRYVDRYYGLNWDALEYYHLVINTGRIGVEGAADIIVQAGRRLPNVQRLAFVT